MEIFNNLWMAISTPNETLVNILLIPASIIENFLIMTIFMTLIKGTSTKKRKLIYIIITTFISFISRYILENPFNVLFNYFFMILIAYKVFNINFIRTCIAMVFTALLFNILGALLLNPYLTIFHIDADQLSSIPVYRMLYVLLIYTACIFAILIIKYRNLKIEFVDNIDKNSKIIIIFNVLIGFLTIIVQSILVAFYIDILPMTVTFFSFLSLISYFAISLYTLTRIFKLILTTRKLESAESYNNTLRILHDNVRGFKHDFDNIVTTIGGYIKTNDMEGLKVYYDQLEDDCQRVNNLYLLNPEVVNNDGIYNLLTKKYYEAESKDIKVNITFLLDLSTLNMKIYEFARILGILLDNAIEAASECDNKVLNLTFRNDFKNSVQLIIIENTYKDKNLDMDKIFEKGVSGKENHTGLCLWEVRKLVKKNNNVNLIPKAENGLFTQRLEIYTK